MSGRFIRRYVLACDGCGRAHDEAANAMEARASAYAAGWRFPSKVKPTGGDSSKASDVCVDCVPNWTARPSLPAQQQGDADA